MFSSNKNPIDPLLLDKIQETTPVERSKRSCWNPHSHCFISESDPPSMVFSSGDEKLIDVLMRVVYRSRNKTKKSSSPKEFSSIQAEISKTRFSAHLPSSDWLCPQVTTTPPAAKVQMAWDFQGSIMPFWASQKTNSQRWTTQHMEAKK